MSPVLLLFVDGIGLGDAGPPNPFSAISQGFFVNRLQAPLSRDAAPFDGDRVILRGLDANLGVEGLPQSATGQATLFTGRNAAAYMQRHISAFPGPKLKSWLVSDHLFSTLVELGFRVDFANAFSPLYDQRLRTRRLRESVTVCCARAAGVRLRTLAELCCDQAVTWDLERDLFLEGMTPHLSDLPNDARSLVQRGPIRAEQAGRDLARIAMETDLLLYETFLSDLVGHGRTAVTPLQCVQRLDGLLCGLASGLGEDSEVSVVITSDHGNLEEPAHRRHTRNQVPLLVWGPARSAFSECRSLLDVSPAIIAAVTGEH